ncbi:YbdD/YjiX family protein [Nocardia sp. NPDC050712]|uniref:YbdD/YjiX family protein n=1 Tax=Nocardia sp. NPDC050712 TaxID=3155518 RepID=UPI0033C4ACB6
MTNPDVPQRGRSTRPAVLRRLLGAVRSLLSWYNAIIGGQDYQRYVAHLRREHPGCEIPSERQYWRDRYDEAERKPQNRCC